MSFFIILIIKNVNFYLETNKVNLQLKLVIQSMIIYDDLFQMNVGFKTCQKYKNVISDLFVIIVAISQNF